MSQLFEDSDAEVDIKTENDYAKNYDIWRKKEELNKLKTKYGEADLSLDDESSSSSEDDEIGIELTEEVEKDFYKTLAQLKKKDPKIYDDSFVFFEQSSNNHKKMLDKKNDANQTMSINDYRRKLLLEKGDIVSDSDEDSRLKNEEKKPTYVEELKQLKENVKKAAYEDDSDNDALGGLFEVRKTDKKQKEKKEADYKLWLVGEKKTLDKETAASLKPLKEYWSDPNLTYGEKYLRDYMLKKRYLENEQKDYVPSYDEIVRDSDENLSEDEEDIEKQEEFENKYNFRFEEPDQEFIKRYPRTIENSLRREDNRRKLKRAETKERKLKEKAEKMEEIKKLRDLKRKEIEDKIEKLKDITGNKDMAFSNEDVDGDFDPEAHDKRMQALFNDEFYEGHEEDQKPKFDMDDEVGLDLEIENFDNWTGNENVGEMEKSYEPHCEDEDFIMDADYDPQDVTQKELLENTKKKKRKRKSKFVEMLASERPKFDPADKRYEDYIDEYYRLDCEDIIDNIPCRFRYRKVPPNSFGLTTEEVLLAKDRELNKWCSLKKAVQIRPDHIEKYDQIAFSKKGQNIELKKKILPSLFIFEEEGKTQQTEEINREEQNQKKDDFQVEKSVSEVPKKSDGKDNLESAKNKKKKRKRSSQTKNISTESTNAETKDFTLDETNILPMKKKKLNSEETVGESSATAANGLESEVNNHIKKRKKKKKKNKNAKIIEENTSDKKGKLPNSTNEKKSISKIKKGKVNNKKRIPEIGLSDARLAAYGLNPKKFKNKKLYGKKQKDK